MTKTYYSLPFRITAAGGTLLGLKLSSAKAVKIHSYSIESEVDGQTVYFYEEGTLKQLSQKWPFNAREGVTKDFTTKARIRTEAVGRDIGINLANATAVNLEIMYSNEDEDLYRE